MNLQTRWYGNAANPGIVSVGTWDPLLPNHERALRDQADHAKRTGSSSVVVILDPNPAIYVTEPSQWPAYSDVNARRHLILGQGIDAVLQVNFRRQDLKLGAADLMRALARHCAVDELWLGATQTLGRGELGSAQRIDSLADERGFRVRRLGRSGSEQLGREVRDSVAAGDIRTAAALTGHVPQWARPTTGAIRLAWHPGTYRVVPMRTFSSDPPWQVRSRSQTTVEIREAPDGMGVLAWPAGHRVLGFVGGPRDGRGGASPERAPEREMLEKYRVRVALRALADAELRSRLKAHPSVALRQLGVPPEFIDQVERALIVDGDPVAAASEGKKTK